MLKKQKIIILSFTVNQYPFNSSMIIFKGSLIKIKTLSNKIKKILCEISITYNLKSFLVLNTGIFFLDSRVQRIMPSLASNPHTFRETSLTNFMWRSTDCVWHGMSVGNYTSMDPVSTPLRMISRGIDLVRGCSA